MNPTKEKIKSVLIGVLIVGMIYLTYAVWFYDSPFGEFSLLSLFDMRDSANISASAGADLDPLGIRPLAIAVSDGSGRRGAIYKSEKSDEIYTILREEVSQSMKKMKDPIVADGAEWEKALISQGVFMDFRADIPLGAFRMWVAGVSDDKTLCARYYVFSTEGKNVKVYMRNSLDGGVHVAETEVSSEKLRAAMGYVKAEKVNFAALRVEDDFKAVSPEMLLTEGELSAPILVMKPYDETATKNLTEACLEIFGLSNVTTTIYDEQDGTDVYIADRVTIKISPDGMVAYTDTREEADKTLGITVESDGEFPTLAEKTEKARRIAASLAGNASGGDGIYIVSVSENEAGTEVVFGRHVGGIPVDMTNPVYFASITIKGKSVRSVRANLAGFDVGTQFVPLVPEHIAAAAVRPGGTPGDLNIRYRHTGGTEVSPAWYIGGIKKQGEGAK